MAQEQTKPRFNRFWIMLVEFTLRIRIFLQRWDCEVLAVKVFRHVTVNLNEARSDDLRRLAIGTAEKLCVTELPGRHRVGSFEMDEADLRWPQVAALLDRWEAAVTVFTRFEAREIENAGWLQMLPSWHHQYPQPEDAFGYRQASYDLTEYCSTCGIGMRQSSPIHLKHEPKWGRRHILQVNWLFEEFFVLPELYADLFKPLGIDAWPVLHHASGRELRSIVQLKIEDASDSELLVDDHPATICPDCSRTKYTPFTRGFFPALRPPPGRPIVKTQEYFGSGASAHRAVIVSGDLLHHLHSRKIRGVEFVPLTK